MGKDYIETIPRQVKDAEIASDAIDHTAVADSFINLNSGDPAASNDTGEGYVLGSLWVNTTSGSQFICTATTAENATWINQEGDSINVPTISGSTYAIVAQGGSSATPNYGSEDAIWTWAMASPFSINDWGEISPSGPSVAMLQANIGSMRTPATAFIAGGNDGTQGSGTRVDTIKSFNLASPSSATDVGEMAGNKATLSSGCDLTYGALAGGVTNPSTALDTIETMTLSASPGNSVDSGSELTAVASYNAGASNSGDGSVYVINGTPSLTNVDKFNVRLSPATVTDWAETTHTGNTRHSSCSDNTNLFGVGGYEGGGDTSRKNMDQWTFSSGGAATDWGDLAYLTRDSASNSGVTYMWTSGGISPPNTVTTQVDRFSASSSGDAVDQGDMTTDKAWHYGTEV